MLNSIIYTFSKNLFPVWSRNFHVGAASQAIKKWPDQNNWVYPPQKPGEKPRPAWVCHYRDHIKYSPEKMYYVACMIRGMSVDEAIKQLTYVKKKGAVIVKEVLEEAQELAVKEHNVEFRSNLWIGDSFVEKSIVIKGIRKHAKMKCGIIHYRYCNYFVRLVEGPPPKDYYGYTTDLPELSGHDKLEIYYENLRNRRIQRTL